MSSINIYEVRRYEDDNKRVCVVKREPMAFVTGRGRTEVFIEGAADLRSLGIEQPIAYAVPLAVPNQDNCSIDALLSAAFELYDDRAQKAVQDMYDEYRDFKEATERRMKLAAVAGTAEKILGAGN